MLKKSAPVLLSFVLWVPALAQDGATTSESGAVNFSLAAGWSFGLPANRAVVSLPGVGTAISPEKKTLTAPSFGVAFTAWKRVVPFFELAAYDAGTATASMGAVESKIQGEILTINGGVRFMASQSRIRPYVEFGGGMLYQKPKITFSTPAGTSITNESGSIGNFMYGGGVQIFGGRRWGMDLGFDGFRATQQLSTGGQNFSRVRIGFFFQTKSILP